METVYLDVELVEYICHPLAVELFDQKDNPITPFTRHDAGLLESALHLPRASFGSSDLYPTLEAKAAALFYSLVKNHPFANGNKRVGATSLIVFLFLNDQLLIVDDDELVQQTLQVAKSLPKEREQLLLELQQWIRGKIKPRQA